MTEIELSVLARQCSDRRIPGRETPTREVAACEERWGAAVKADWRFATAAARVKLKRRHPTVEPR